MKKTSGASLALHLLEIELTNRCDRACPICYKLEWDGRQIIDMPLPLVKELITFAGDEHVDTVVLTGGETCMYPYFNDLLEWIANNNYTKKIKFVIQSNGKIKETQTKLLQGCSIHLSYEYNRSPARTSDQQTILDLASYYNNISIYAYLFITVHNQSLPHLDEMISSALSRGLDVSVNIFVPTGDYNEHLAIPPDQYAAVMQKIYSLYREGKIQRPTCPLFSLFRKEKTKKFKRIKGGCTAGIASLTVRPNGDVMPCPFFYLIVDNVYKNHIADIWLDSPILAQIRDRARYDQPCRSCHFLSYCGGCRARAYRHSNGNLRAADPACFK